MSDGLQEKDGIATMNRRPRIMSPDSVAMFILFFMTVFAVATKAVVTSPQPFTPLGVLIGLHRVGGGEDQGANSAPPSSGQLRTLWLHQLTHSAPANRVELSNLLVPRRSGFWRMGLFGQCEEEKAVDPDLGTETTVADHLWAAPLGTRPEVHIKDPDYLRFVDGPCVARDVYCENDWTTGIYWVWPDFASLDLGSRGECGAHPAWNPGFTVRRLDDLAKPVRVGEVLGQSDEDSFRKSFEKERAEPDRVPCEEKFDPYSWHIEREGGSWKAEGWSTTHRLCGFGIEYAVNVDVSAMTGSNDDTSRWQLLKSRWPQLTDAHTSPDGRWTLATTDSEILIFERTSTGAPLLKWPKSSREHLVMVEWVSGSNVRRWNDQVIRLRHTKEPPPKVLRK